MGSEILSIENCYLIKSVARSDDDDNNDDKGNYTLCIPDNVTKLDINSEIRRYIDKNCKD